MKLRLETTKTERGDAVSFAFRPDQTFQWQAGQFLKYTLPHDDPDERGIERYFTISSAPHEGFVMLTTRIGGRNSSFKRALMALKPGDPIEAEGPDGDFVAGDPEPERIWVAGGIGITPYRSILLDLKHKNRPIRAALIYSNSTPEFIYREELEAIRNESPDFRIRYVVSPERITDRIIHSEAADPANAAFYISGPEPMVEAFEKTLPETGIPEAHIKRDYFPGYAWPIGA